MSCTKCRLGLQTELRSGCIRSTWEKKQPVTKPRITFIVDNPTKEDDAFDEMMTERTSTSGQTGPQMVWNIIDEIGIPRDVINIVPLTRCAIKSKAIKLNDLDVSSCLPYLWDELRNNKPEVIVCMGLDVTKYLTGIKKLANLRGNYVQLKTLKGFDPVPEDLLDIPVTATSAPGAVWSQQVTGKGIGKFQFIEDVSGLWRRINSLVRDARCDYKWLETYEEIDAYFSEVEQLYVEGKIPGAVVDVETNQQLDPWNPKSKLVAIGFSHKRWFARAVKIHHYQDRLFSEYGEPMWQAFVKRLQLFFDRVPVGGWNFKFDTKWIRKHTGATPRMIFFDGHLAHYLVNNFDGARHNLKDFSIEDLKTPIAEAALHAVMQSLAKKGYAKEELHMGNVDEETLLTYLGGDVDCTFGGYLYLDPMIDNDHVYMSKEYQAKYPGWNHRSVYTVLLDTVISFAEIEENGIAVDDLMLEHLQQTYPERLKSLLDPILQTEWAKMMLPTMDPKKEQKTLVTNYINLSKLLYEAAQFPAEQLGFEKKIRKGAGGVLSEYYPTGKPFRVKLVEWAAENGHTAHVKLIKDIEAYKKAEKLYTAYILRMQQYIEGDSMMHTVYNLAGTATGRASTSKPSLHIIPKKSDVKKMFKSRWHDEGGIILQMDYSTLEMRIVAAISNDPELIRIFNSGADTHRETAAKIFHKAPADVTDDERSAGKTIAFGVLYGMMAAAMSWRTGLPVDECEKHIASFFKQFGGIAAWMDKQKKDTRSRAVPREGTGRLVPRKYFRKGESKMQLVDYEFEQYGYITTVFNRKRILRDANHWKSGFANGADRQAANTPIQSTASDIALAAVLRIHKRLKSENFRSKLFGFIHDSIEVDTHPSEFVETYILMKEEMEKRPKELYPWLNVPIKVSAEVGSGWGYMVEIDDFDLSTNVLTLKGACAYHKEACSCHEVNVLSVARALATHYVVNVLSVQPIEKGGKVTGTKATMRLQKHSSVPGEEEAA